MRRVLACALVIVLMSGALARGQEAGVDAALARVMAVEYRRETAPLSTAQVQGSALVSAAGDSLTTGDITVTLAPEGFFVRAMPEPGVQLLLRPLGGDLSLTHDLLAGEGDVVTENRFSGVDYRARTDWADAALRLEIYPSAPGLMRTRLALTRTGDPPAEAGFEWTFVDAEGDEAPAEMTWYAEPAPFAAPVMYGCSAALDATLLYVVDRTALNPLFHAARLTPTQFPGRRGRSFGHAITRADLRALPEGVPITVYDAYLYLVRGQPADEREMFARFLQQMSQVYDLLHKPVDTALPDWRDLGARTIRDLEDAGVWVTLDGKRYARAYWGDTRQSAELITQLDLLGGIVRYEQRWGDTPPLDDELWGVVPDFFDPEYGMLVNSGPVSLARQARGDTWYELGHALRVAELALETGHATARDLALRSAARWMDFAHTVAYRFPQFYDFNTWKGVGREPDAAGGYAMYMLTLWDLTGERVYLDEAQAAVEALAGHGFSLAYETHMTAAAAAACARLYTITGDAHYLDLALGPIANLVRLSWLWESDYGASIAYRTFWGLLPTQRSGVITPKEQYEAWAYLRQFVHEAGYEGVTDDAVKLAAEFLSYSLTTLPYTLPPLLPEGVASAVATTYDTVQANNLALYIPLEDLRHGWQPAGGIGQEVYGAGMAPTLGALAYQQIGDLLVYSPVPVEREGRAIVFAGTPQNRFPVQVWGAAPEGVDAIPCGEGWCFLARGGQVVAFGG